MEDAEAERRNTIEESTKNWGRGFESSNVDIELNLRN